jgi:hypothetical protein
MNTVGPHGVGVAEETMVPLSVLLALALGVAIGVLAVMIFGFPQPPPQVLGGFAGVPRLSIMRDASGRIVSVEGG